MPQMRQVAQKEVWGSRKTGVEARIYVHIYVHIKQTQVFMLCTNVNIWLVRQLMHSPAKNNYREKTKNRINKKNKKYSERKALY